MYVGYIDPAKGTQDIQPVSTIGNNGLLSNPFCGPGGMQFLHYHIATQAMWGTGMPWLLMQWQDFYNVSMTWTADMMQQCASKWAYEKGTIERGQEANVLNNDPWRPIPWERKVVNSSRPERIAGAQMPQILSEVNAMSVDGMGRLAMIAPVQSGIGAKRDGSGKGYDTLIQEAESVPDDRVISDELSIGDLLRSTLVDTIRISTIDQLRRLTGGRVGDSFLYELKRDDPRLRIVCVELDPTTMRPKTKQQTEARYTGFITNQVMPQDQGLREMIRAGVKGINSDQEQAYALQEAEVERMRQGQPAEVYRDDEHAWHIDCLRRTLNAPARLDYEPEFTDALQQHMLEHQIAMEQTTGMALGQPEPTPGQPEQPGMGSPPANASAGRGA